MARRKSSDGTKRKGQVLDRVSGRRGQAGSKSWDVRGARSDEVVLEVGEWRIPAKRMKYKREHRVPLSGRVREIPAEARQIENSSDLVFPFPADRRLSDFALSGLLRELEIPAVPHGFRSSFQDWAAESTNAPHAVMETALSHVVRNQVAAYARSDLFKRRRVVMGQRADFLAASDPPVSSSARQPSCKD